MGDFDRKENPGDKKDETKKFVVLVVLAAGFLGYLGFHYIHNDAGPQPARGAMNGDFSGQGNTPEESPEQIKDQLLQDPTNTNNLLKIGTDDASLNVVPRNPFRMNRAWKESLIKPVETPATKPSPQPVANVTPERDPQPKPAYVPKVVKPEDYKLEIVLVENGHLTAIVNDVSVTVGSILKDAVVVAVTNDSVTLRQKDEPQGATITLRMHADK